MWFLPLLAACASAQPLCANGDDCSTFEFEPTFGFTLTYNETSDVEHQSTLRPGRNGLNVPVSQTLFVQPLPDVTDFVLEYNSTADEIILSLNNGTTVHALSNVEALVKDSSLSLLDDTERLRILFDNSDTYQFDVVTLELLANGSTTPFDVTLLESNQNQTVFPVVPTTTLFGDSFVLSGLLNVTVLGTPDAQTPPVSFQLQLGSDIVTNQTCFVDDDCPRPVFLVCEQNECWDGMCMPAATNASLACNTPTDVCDREICVDVQDETTGDFMAVCMNEQIELCCTRFNDCIEVMCDGIKAQCTSNTPGVPGTCFCPTLSPTLAPTGAPTSSLTEVPTQAPTEAPSEPPTTPVPTDAPTEPPTESPTESPSLAPTKVPTQAPSLAPTKVPTQAPSLAPTETPTEAPTLSPTPMPTQLPPESCLEGVGITLLSNEIECSETNPSELEITYLFSIQEWNELSECSNTTYTFNASFTNGGTDVTVVDGQVTSGDSAMTPNNLVLMPPNPPFTVAPPTLFTTFNETISVGATRYHKYTLVVSNTSLTPGNSVVFSYNIEVFVMEQMVSNAATSALVDSPTEPCQVECTVDEDCVIQGNLCKIGECENEVCVFSDKKFNDFDPCTEDKCNIVDGTALHVPIEGCCFGPEDCTDTQPPNECLLPFCRRDNIQEPAGQCDFYERADCCLVDEDCANEQPFCRAYVCNSVTNTCEDTGPLECEDPDPSDLCAVAECDHQTGQCENVTLDRHTCPGACCVNEQCIEVDGKWCATEEGAFAGIGIPCEPGFCSPPTPPPTPMPTRECVDDSECPADKCQTGICNPNGFCEVTDVVCKDNNPLTTGMCDPWTGMCMFVRNYTLCLTVDDCFESGKPCDVSECVGAGQQVPGTCQYSQRDGCCEVDSNCTNPQNLCEIYECQSDHTCALVKYNECLIDDGDHDPCTFYRCAPETGECKAEHSFTDCLGGCCFEEPGKCDLFLEETCARKNGVFLGSKKPCDKSKCMSVFVPPPPPTTPAPPTPPTPFPTPAPDDACPISTECYALGGTCGERGSCPVGTTEFDGPCGSGNCACCVPCAALECPGHPALPCTSLGGCSASSANDELGTCAASSSTVCFGDEDCACHCDPHHNEEYVKCELQLPEPCSECEPPNCGCTRACGPTSTCSCFCQDNGQMLDRCGDTGECENGQAVCACDEYFPCCLPGDTQRADTCTLLRPDECEAEGGLVQEDALFCGAGVCPEACETTSDCSKQADLCLFTVCNTKTNFCVHERKAMCPSQHD